jgi:NAD(P)-dependent dehydrogenase (short-subunit alcohol dehydrogenase family)
MGKLINQVAVVTGACKGIGAGIAKALAAEGASVVSTTHPARRVRTASLKKLLRRAAKPLPCKPTFPNPLT